VSDQGIAVGGFDKTAVAVTPRTLPMLPLASARAAAFSPDGARLLVLTGPAWTDVDDCSAVPAASQLVTIDLTGATPTVSAPEALSPGTTDIAFDPSGDLLLAVPCGAGIVRRDGTVVVKGSGLYAIGFSVGVPAGVERVLAPVTAAETDGATGQARFGGGAAPVLFPIQPQYVRTALQQNPQAPVSEVLVSLDPSSTATYSIAATPEGHSLIFASRTRYRAAKKHLVEFDLTNTNNQNESFYCDLTVDRDVYTVTAIDATSGSLEYRRTTGRDDATRCTIHCHYCHFVCTFNPICQLRCDDQDTSCAVSDGFAPSGIDVLMGSR
jgi:hypothetical protein